VVSRKRSCCSCRARFFLYFATYFPLASPNTELRSNGCMIIENVTLMARTKSCQARVLQAFARLTNLRFSLEQNQFSWCLSTRLSGNGHSLEARIPAPGGAA
jgi:hypothetical protein